MKKPRSDSLFAKLDADQRRQVVAWAMEDALSYQEIARRLKEWGVAASEGALCNFVQRHSLGWRLDSANRAAQELAAEMPAELSDALKRAALSKVYALTFEEMSAKDAVKIANLARQNLRDERTLEVLERRLAIAEEQHAAAMAQIAAAKGAAADATLTAEERESRIRQIFGLA